MPATRPYAALLLAALFLAPALQAQRLFESEARARFQEILPPEKEMGWEAIPWRSTMLEAVIEANAKDKPLLIYQMRGHPLGAT